MTEKINIGIYYKMPKVGMKSYAEQHIGQKVREGVKIGQKQVAKKSGSKPVVLEADFMESLKKLKL